MKILSLLLSIVIALSITCLFSSCFTKEPSNKEKLYTILEEINTVKSYESLSNENWRQLLNQIVTASRSIKPTQQNILEGQLLSPEKGTLLLTLLEKNFSADQHKQLMERVDFSSAYLKDANLEGAQLNYANLRNVYFDGVKLQSASLIKANLVNANILDCNLNHANLSKANCRTTNFTGSFLNSANLNSIYLRDANLENISYEGATWEDANLSGTLLESKQKELISTL